MNKKIATGLILIILSILLYLQFTIISVVLFGIGITILGYEAMKSFLYKNVEEVPLIEKEPTKSIKDLYSLEEIKVENKYSEPMPPVGSWGVDSTVKEIVTNNKELITPVKKHRRKPKAKSVGEKIVEQSRTKTKPEKPKVKKAE